jgi:hypothetical protein
MRHVYSTLKAQETSLSALYNCLREAITQNIDGALKMKALSEYIPEFLEEVDVQLVKINECTTERDWRSAAVHVKSTKDALKALCERMAAVEEALKKYVGDIGRVEQEAKSKAKQLQGAGIVEKIGRGAIGSGINLLRLIRSVVRCTFYVAWATAAIPLNCWNVYNLVCFSSGLVEIGSTQGTLALAATAGQSVASFLAIGGVTIVALCAVGGVCYGAYCLMGLSSNALKSLRVYKEEQQRKNHEAALMIAKQAGKARESGEAAMAKTQRIQKTAEECTECLENLQKLAEHYATLKDNGQELDAKKQEQEMRRCCDKFHKKLNQMQIEDIHELRDLAPTFKAMVSFLDAVEPRTEQQLYDDEAALAMSHYVYDPKKGVSKLPSCEFKNVRLHNAPREGLFSHIAVAEVHHVEGDADLYPALFIAFRGSVGIEWLNNLNFAPSWHVFNEICPDRNIAIHRGFYEEIESAYELLKATLKENIERSQIKRIVFTGHSHGGALAQAALPRIFKELKKKEMRPDLPNDWQDLSPHLQSLLEESTAVCFASPQIIGFRETSVLGEQLAKFMHDRVVNYAFRLDPVPRCFSHVDLSLLSDVMSSYGFKTWLLDKFGIGSSGAEQLIREHREALDVYKHVSKVVLLCDEQECPEKWGKTWSPCNYDIRDHDINVYADALRRFKVRDTKLKAYVLTEGEPSKVLCQIRK